MKDEDQPGAARPGTRRDGAEPRAQDERQHEPEPFISISSNDLPEPFEAPWFDRSSPFGMLMPVKSKDFAADDPASLREAEARYIGQRLVLMAENADTHPDQGTRELAAVTIEYFRDGHYRTTAFDIFIGLRRAGGGFAREVGIVARNTFVRELALMEPWFRMHPPAAAADMRRAFDRYYASSWKREKDLAEPPKRRDAALALFWQIAKTGVPGPMPSIQTLKTHIEAARLK